jgi:hypothetical protein
MMINPDSIADTIMQAPAWALIGLTAPRDTLREDAAREVAQHICLTLLQTVAIDTAQLTLPL